MRKIHKLCWGKGVRCWGIEAPWSGFQRGCNLRGPVLPPGGALAGDPAALLLVPPEVLSPPFLPNTRSQELQVFPRKTLSEHILMRKEGQGRDNAGGHTLKG